MHENGGLDFELFKIDPVGAILETYGSESETFQFVYTLDSVLPIVLDSHRMHPIVSIKEDFPDLVDWSLAYKFLYCINVSKRSSYKKRRALILILFIS